MPSTPNYNLTKPIEDDYYDVEIQNENMDKIDIALTGHKGRLDNLEANNSTTDNMIGDRIISDTTAPTGNAGKITTLLGWLAYMIKAITGKSSWRTAPAITLEATKTHVDNSDIHVTKNKQAEWDDKAAGKHASSHLTGGSDPIPVATTSADGLMRKEHVEELGNKLDKDDPNAIVTAKSANFTAPSGTAPLTVSSSKRVDLLNTEYWNDMNSYFNLTGLGLNNGATMTDVLTAMRAKSMAFITVDADNRDGLGLTLNGTIFAIKYSSGRSHITFVSISGWVYNAIYAGTTFQGWVRTPLSDGTTQTRLNAELHNGWGHYKNLSELGLTNNQASIPEIFNALPINGVLEFLTPASSGTLPYANAMARLVKLSNIYMFGTLSRGNPATTEKYYGVFLKGNTPEWSGWKRSSVNDGTLQTDLNAERTNGIKTFNSLTTPVGASNGDLWFPPPS